MTDDNRLGSDEAVETQEWLESLEWVLQNKGPERVRQLLEELDIHAQKAGVRIPFSANTPHINTIPVGEEPPYPGSREIERRIKSIIRWNAMAMVVRANMIENGIGGHISTYASAATLYEVAFNHFLHGKSYPHPWLMPGFWQFPTVSMGLGPIMAIYQARFMRYLSDRGAQHRRNRKVWAFLGDGEMDEPESLGAISLAARERSTT
jgi:pyruvate dehydrogenase E1 component